MASDRENLIAAARAMAARGLSAGTSGNVSLRGAEGILITPSAVPYEELTPEMIPLLREDGSYEGRFRPSSEWRFHLDVYFSRPEVG
ncbi:MAG: class II aldolase/adducin family protein, partial [Rhodospirillales bacterium]|nr:class II aldolase/adducin family protein [Rhodospirillales bacterium]